MDTWLKCQVGLGMFSTEFAVEGESVDGTGFSLFAPEEYVEVDPCHRGMNRSLDTCVWPSCSGIRTRC